jgi:hypothetical protein
MPSINATFCNNYGESRAWVIKDYACDPNVPKIIYNDYLDAGACTDSQSLCSNDGSSGRISYQRSDGPEQMVDVSNGDQVQME